MLTSANENKQIAKTGNAAHDIIGEFGHLQANMNERRCANEQSFDTCLSEGRTVLAQEQHV